MPFVYACLSVSLSTLHFLTRHWCCQCQLLGYNDHLWPQWICKDTCIHIAFLCLCMYNSKETYSTLATYMIWWSQVYITSITTFGIFGEIVLKVRGIHLSVLVTSEALLYPLTFFCLCPFVGNSDWNRRQIVSDDTKTSLETRKEKNCQRRKLVLLQFSQNFIVQTMIILDFCYLSSNFPKLSVKLTL